MKPSLRTGSAVAIGASVLFLAACAGGGFSPPTPGGAQALSHSRGGLAALTSSGTVPNPYPFTQGDQFNYSYNLTHSARKPGKPLNKSFATGTLVDTIGSNTTFNGQQAVDVSEVLSYTNTDNHHKRTGTGTNTTDDYENFVPNKSGGLNYVTYGWNLSGSSSNSDGSSSTTQQTVTYGGPFVLDILPETKNQSWKDEAAYTLQSQTQTTKNSVTTTDTSTYTRNANGSYTRTLARTSPSEPTYNQTDTQNSDASGSTTNNGKNAGTTTFSAPARQNGQYVITVTVSPASGPPTTAQVPDWFPGNGAAHHLVVDDKKDLGTATVPAKCGVAAGMISQELRESFSFLDAVNGTYNSESIDDYVVSGMGLVCIDHQRLLDTYDNLVTGQLLNQEHFNETTALTSESLQQLRTKHLIVGFGSRNNGRG